jgi:hypothetical protein
VQVVSPKINVQTLAALLNVTTMPLINDASLRQYCRGTPFHPTRYLVADVCTWLATMNGRAVELPTKPLMTTAQATEFLREHGVNVSRNTVGWWRAVGTGPQFIRIGSKGVRYAEQDLRDWIASDAHGERQKFTPRRHRTAHVPTLRYL